MDIFPRSKFRHVWTHLWRLSLMLMCIVVGGGNSVLATSAHASPVSPQQVDYVTTNGAVRFGFVLPDGSTVHYRLPVNLKTVLDGIWNSKLDELNQRVKDSAHDANSHLYGMSSNLALAAESVLQVRQVGETLSLRYALGRSHFKARYDQDCSVIIDFCPDPTFTVDYDLALELSAVATNLAQPLEVKSASIKISGADVSGDNLYSDLILFIGQVLFGAESKIERSLNETTIDMTKDVNLELQPVAGFLAHYVPANLVYIDTSVDNGGAISLCFKLTPEQHCDFPNSQGNPLFTFPPVLTSASALRAPDFGTWYRDAIPVALSTVGGSGGPIHSFYRIDGGPEAEATSPVSIADDGMHTLSFSSVDSSGEREPDQTLTVGIDRTPPTIAVQTSDDDTPVWTVVTTDTLSGVDPASVQVSFDGQTFKPYTGPIPLEDHAILYARASDMVGNIASATPVHRILDNFNRQDESLGPAWSGKAKPGYYRVDQQGVDVEKGGLLYWQPTAFGISQEAVVTLKRIDQVWSRVSLLLKVQGDKPNVANGAIEVRYEGQRHVVRIRTRTRGQNWQHIAEIPATFTDGDQFSARALTDGTIQVYRNGALLGQTNAGSFFANIGGRIGLRTIDAHDTVLDDFGGGSLTP